MVSKPAQVVTKARETVAWSDDGGAGEPPDGVSEGEEVMRWRDEEVILVRKNSLFLSNQ
jgi:hypothetical protein